MATVNFDSRPTVIGNKMMITGSFTADNAAQTIDFNGFLADVDTFSITAVKSTVVAVPTHSCITAGTVILTLADADEEYRFMALGDRN